jgi:hypothetical protein
VTRAGGSVAPHPLAAAPPAVLLHIGGSTASLVCKLGRCRQQQSVGGGSRVACACGCAMKGAVCTRAGVAAARQRQCSPPGSTTGCLGCPGAMLQALLRKPDFNDF